MGGSSSPSLIKALVKPSYSAGSTGEAAQIVSPSIRPETHTGALPGAGQTGAPSFRVGMQLLLASLVPGAESASGNKIDAKGDEEPDPATGRPVVASFRLGGARLFAGQGGDPVSDGRDGGSRISQTGSGTEKIAILKDGRARAQASMKTTARVRSASATHTTSLPRTAHTHKTARLEVAAPTVQPESASPAMTSTAQLVPTPKVASPVVQAAEPSGASDDLPLVVLLPSPLTQFESLSIPSVLTDSKGAIAPAGAANHLTQGATQESAVPGWRREFASSFSPRKSSGSARDVVDLATGKEGAATFAPVPTEGDGQSAKPKDKPAPGQDATEPAVGKRDSTPGIAQTMAGLSRAALGSGAIQTGRPGRSSAQESVPGLGSGPREAQDGPTGAFAAVSSQSSFLEPAPELSKPNPDKTSLSNPTPLGLDQDHNEAPVPDLEPVSLAPLSRDSNPRTAQNPQASPLSGPALNPDAPGSPIEDPARAPVSSGARSQAAAPGVNRIEPDAERPSTVPQFNPGRNSTQETAPELNRIGVVSPQPKANQNPDQSVSGQHGTGAVRPDPNRDLAPSTHLGSAEELPSSESEDQRVLPDSSSAPRPHANPAPVSEPVVSQRENQGSVAQLNPEAATQPKRAPAATSVAAENGNRTVSTPAESPKGSGWPVVLRQIPLQSAVMSGDPPAAMTQRLNDIPARPAKRTVEATSISFAGGSSEFTPVAVSAVPGQSASVIDAAVEAKPVTRGRPTSTIGGITSTSAKRGASRAAQHGGDLIPERISSQLVDSLAMADEAGGIRGTVNPAVYLAGGRSIATDNADPRESFALLDSQGALGKPAWVHAGSQQAEAGFEDPALGWVGIRAEAGGGRVHAEVVSGSADAAQALSGQMAGLNAYLTEHHTPVETVTLTTPENGWTGSGNGRDAGQSFQHGASQQGAGQQAAQQAGSSESSASSRNAESLSGAPRFAPSARDSDGSNPAAEPEGIHISVMA